MIRSLETRARRFSEAYPIATKLIVATGVNKLVSEGVWGMDRRSKLYTLPYHGPETLTSGVVFPGMGNSGDGSRKMANKLAEVLPEQQWGYVQYDNSRILKTEDMANLLTGYMELTGSTYVDEYVSSMGLTIGLEAARIADTPIGILFINSSPSEKKDGYGSRVGTIAAKFPDTGVAGKAIGTFIADSIRPGRSEVISNLAHAGREAISGGSPKLFISQFKILESVNLERDWRRYSRILHPAHTIAIYASPKEENDNTVKVKQAYLKLKRFFAHFGIELELLEMPYAGHADTEEALRLGEKRLKEIATARRHLIYPNL